MGRVGQARSDNIPPFSVRRRSVSLTAYHNKVEVMSGTQHVRYVPGTLAKALVDTGAARPLSTHGRVRTVLLAAPAGTHAERIGPPSAPRLGVRFYRWLNLDHARIVEHHPRALYQVGS